MTPTVEEIKRKYIANKCGHFFDNSWFEAAGQTLEDYAVTTYKNNSYLYIKPNTKRRRSVFTDANRRFRDDFETMDSNSFSVWKVERNGDLDCVTNQKLKSAIYAKVTA